MAKRTIVFIDDEKINLLAFRAQFRREYHVHCTSDPAEFLTIIRSESVHCVFSDQRMPGTTGTELLTRARELHPFLRAAIISGYPEDAAIQTAFRSGTVDAVFEKPYTTQEITEFIEAHPGNSPNAPE